MNFETDLRTLLIADSVIGPMVTEPERKRVYWQIRTQGTALPAIVLHMVNGARDQTFDGAMGTQGHQVQFDCMADEFDDAVALRNAVIAVIESPGSAGTTEFQGGNVDLHRGIAEDTTAGVVRTEQVRATIWFN